VFLPDFFETIIPIARTIEKKTIINIQSIGANFIIFLKIYFGCINDLV
jgi:hypothetical protein